MYETDGYYLRRNKMWDDAIPSSVELVYRGKLKDGIEPVFTENGGFAYTRVYVYTARELDELILEAYMAGASGLMLTPELLQKAKEDNSSGHKTRASHR